MELFHVAIIQRPTKKEAEDGTKEKLVYYTLKPLLARNAETAGMEAVLSDEFPKGLDLNACEVKVRPFG